MNNPVFVYLFGLSLYTTRSVAARELFDFRHADAVEVALDGVLECGCRNGKFDRFLRDPQKGYSMINEAEVDIFLEFPCFLYDSRFLVPLPSLNPVCIYGSSRFMYC